MKKIVSVLVFALLISFFTMNTLAQGETIKIYVNGNVLDTPVNPISENGNTLVPMKSVFEALGLVVKWDSSTKTVTGTGEGIEIRLTIGANKAYVNGAEKTLSVPAKIVNGSTMVPIRFISESAGYKVEWDNATKTIYISTQTKNASSSLYVVAGTGKYKGYMMLKGYPDENLFQVYYKGTPESFFVSYIDLRNIDIKEVITWKYQDKTYKNTRSELYSFFSDTTWFRSNFGVYDYTFTEDWLFDTFGNVYLDWMDGMSFSEEAYRLVNRYFEESGQLKIENNVTLTPDAEIILDEPKVEEPSAEEIINKIKENMEKNLPDEVKEFNATWIGERELEESYSVTVFRAGLDSIKFYKEDDTGIPENIFTIENVPSSLNEREVLRGNNISYQYTKGTEINNEGINISKGLYFNREDLKNAGIID